MKLFETTINTYLPKTNKPSGYCKVQTWDTEFLDKPVVLFTELKDNPGTSVTNCVKRLIEYVINNFGRHFDGDCYYFEVYEEDDVKRNGVDQINFSTEYNNDGSVVVNLLKSGWKPMFYQDFIKLIKGPVKVTSAPPITKK